MYSNIRKNINNYIKNSINNNIPIQHQLYYVILNFFWIVSFVNIILKAIITQVRFDNISVMIQPILVFGVINLAIFVSYKYKVIEAVIIILVILVTVIAFPIIFCMIGAEGSGMPVWLVFGGLLSFTLLSGGILIVVVCLQVAAYIGVYILAYYNPQWITPMSSRKSMYIDILTATLITIFTLGLAIRYQQRLYNKRNKELESALLELKINKKQLEKANSVKTEFLANISHEMKTPLNTIIGMSELVMQKPNTQFIFSELNMINTTGNSLLETINKILIFSENEVSNIDVNEVIYRTQDIIEKINLFGQCELRKRNKIKKVKLDIKQGESVPNILKGDHKIIYKILEVLLENAIKYTDNGEISIYVEGKKINSNYLIQYTVKDTGRGISKDNINNIFDSFKRVDKERNRNIEGSGLGLAICKKYIEAIGGEITVDSEYNIGTTFTVKYVQRRNIALHKSGSSIKALIVDDSRYNLKVLKLYLESYDISVDMVDSGTECIEKSKKGQYDIIIIDHRMSELDGIETLHILRHIYKLNTIILVATANAGQNSKYTYYKEGFDGFITKPITNSQINDIVKEFNLCENNKLDNIVIDYEAGLKYSGDNKKLYKDLLDLFIEEYNEKKEKINNYIAKNEWKNYVVGVHDIKNNAYGLGMNKLGDYAKELENQGKKHILSQEKTKMMFELYEEYIKYLQKD